MFARPISWRGWAPGLALALLLVAGAALARGQEKIRIKTADELPRHSYKIPGSVSELLKSDDALMALAKQVRADTEADLAKYEIADAPTMRELTGVLLSVALLENRLDDASRLIERLRELEDKEAKKLTTGLVAGSYIAARRAVPDDRARFQATFEQTLLERLRPLPWDVVGDILEQTKGRMEVLSEDLLLGMAKGSLDPVAAATNGEIGADTARSALGMGTTLRVQLPLKERILAAYSQVITEHRVTKPDIWAERAVALSPAEKRSPIVVGIWDSGVDVQPFRSQLFVNPKEQPNGQDDDGNGFVDDLHGIAFDLEAHPTPDLLHPIDALNSPVEEVAKYMKGFTDLQAALDTPDATAVRKVLSGLKGDEVKNFMEDLGLYGNYAHGTHVAGIALDGNPFARLLVARISFDYRMVPFLPTLEWVRREAASFQATVDYMKQHNVRVVNMSWGHDQDEIESPLEKHGVGETAEKRAELAREMYKVQRDGLYAALKSAPEILFVVAAGNADSDVEFDEVIPSSFDLPNVLVVGAVDQAGDPTNFTSFGRTVQVYASGFEVDSYVPGGRRMKLSGTSMASPQVANLAAKLVARDPSLKPPQVIELIKQGSVKVEKSGKTLLLIHPKRTLELWEKRTTAAAPTGAAAPAGR